MGLAPMVIQQIFRIITEINAQGTTILLVEQNAQQALSRTDRAYILETGEITTTGTGRGEPEVEERAALTFARRARSRLSASTAGGSTNSSRVASGRVQRSTWPKRSSNSEVPHRAFRSRERADLHNLSSVNFCA